MIDSAWKAWYRAQHDLRCRASGETFEGYATGVLARLHADYLNPDPMGTLGDGAVTDLPRTAPSSMPAMASAPLRELTRRPKINWKQTSPEDVPIGQPSRCGGL